MVIGERKNLDIRWPSHATHVFVLKLTFTGLQAFKPPVINFSVLGTSTVLKPSTTGSATTDSTGFIKRAALRARHRVSICCGDGWSAD